jgi:hypothetical protein
MQLKSMLHSCCRSANTIQLTTSFSKYYTTDSVCKLVNFFEQIGLTQAYAHECAQNLATDVYNSKVANRLAFTIQQLMLREAQFSSVLEPWTFVNGLRGIEIDAPKLATASAFVYSKRYNFSYPWASMLIGLSEHYFSTTVKRTKEDLINVLILTGLWASTLQYSTQTRAN